MCYHNHEVSIVEERNEPLEQEKAGYVPRPKWQIILAWVGLAVFVAFLVMFYTIIFRGGV